MLLLSASQLTCLLREYGLDTDTDSYLTDQDDEDEEYLRIIHNNDPSDVSAHLCEAYFQAKR
eukprot:12891663-Prorocentrum_lima.AAC.1